LDKYDQLIIAYIYDLLAKKTTTFMVVERVSGAITEK
jgi:hypothetical protein